MAIKLDYVARETATNLTRNITLTVASILTVVVSLTLFGSAFMLNQGVNNANDRFKGGIEFIVFLQPDSTQEQKDSVEARPRGQPGRPRDHTTSTRTRPTRSSSGSSRVRPSSSRRSRPRCCPPSFRVAPVTKDPDVVQALGETFQGEGRGLRGGLRLPGGEGHPGDLQQDRRALPARRRPPARSPPACSSSTRSGWRCSPGARSR